LTNKKLSHEGELSAKIVEEIRDDLVAEEAKLTRLRVENDSKDRSLMEMEAQIGALQQQIDYRSTNEYDFDVSTQLQTKIQECADLQRRMTELQPIIQYAEKSMITDNKTAEELRQLRRVNEEVLSENRRLNKRLYRQKPSTSFSEGPSAVKKFRCSSDSDEILIIDDEAEKGANFDDLEAEVSRIKKELEKLPDDKFLIENLKENLRSTQENLRSTQEKFRAVEKFEKDECEKLRRNVAELQAQNQSANGKLLKKLIDLRNENETLRAKFSSAKDENETLRAKFSSAKDENEALREKFSKIF